MPQTSMHPKGSTARMRVTQQKGNCKRPNPGLPRSQSIAGTVVLWQSADFQPHDRSQHLTHLHTRRLAASGPLRLGALAPRRPRRLDAPSALRLGRLAGSPGRRWAGSLERQGRRVGFEQYLPGRRVAGGRVAGLPGRQGDRSPGRRVAGSPGQELLSHVPLQGHLLDLPSQNISLRSPKLGQSPFTLLCNTSHFVAAVQICAMFTDFDGTLAAITLVAKCRWPQKVLGVRRKPDVWGLQVMPFADTHVIT